MLTFMGENKRLLNIHEQKFIDLAAFQANTIVFQSNTNASLKNLETQVGHLALAMKSQSKDAFPSDTKNNPKDCMVVTVRSGREIEGRKERENKTKEATEEFGGELKQYSLEVSEEEITTKMQQKQQTEEGDLRKKEEVQAYKP